MFSLLLPCLDGTVLTLNEANHIPVLAICSGFYTTPLDGGHAVEHHASFDVATWLRVCLLALGVPIVFFAQSYDDLTKRFLMLVGCQ